MGMSGELASRALALDRAVVAIHEASLDDAKLPSALTRLSDALAGAGVYFAVRSATEHEHPPLFAMASDNTRPEPTAEYHAHLGYLDQRLRTVMRLRAGQIWTCQEQLDDGFVRKDGLLDDFLIRHGYRYTLAARVLEADGESALLGVQRTPGQGAFEESDRRRLDAMLPALGHAARVRQLLRRAENRAARRQAMLDRFTTAALLVDGRGRVLEQNAAADALLRLGDALALRHGSISAHRTDEICRLHQLVADATRAAARSGAGGGVSRLSRPDGESYVALVTPLAAKTANGCHEPAALLLITDPGRRCHPPAEHLRLLYGLTPAEARLAVALCDGDGLVTTAQRLSISHETARHYLKRIGEKTGCRRQVDLVRLLLSGAGAMSANISVDPPNGG